MEQFEFTDISHATMIFTAAPSQDNPDEVVVYWMEGKELVDSTYSVAMVDKFLADGSWIKV